MSSLHAVAKSRGLFFETLWTYSTNNPFFLCGARAWRVLVRRFDLFCGVDAVAFLLYSPSRVKLTVCVKFVDIPFEGELFSPRAKDQAIQAILKNSPSAQTILA
jgi:hypothetical protein